jgi:queuine tRNA-ribosyltransferase
MYAVVHGGIHPHLRERSCKFLGNLPFDGYAIGGSVGKNKSEMVEMLQTTTPFLPRDKPNHLLGIGDLGSIEASIPLGIDTFDSSYPTKAARHGVALTKAGHFNITKNENNTTFEPLERDCTCPTCQRFTIAYLHHLFKAKEMTALSLTTIHNLHFMVELMARYREKIASGEI